MCEKKRKRLFIGGVLLLLLLYWSVSFLLTSGAVTHSYRVMTYNIHHAEGIDGRLDVMRIAQHILRNQPDVVALQEVDSATQRVDRKDILGLLAQETKMHASFASAIPFQGGKYGVGLLSREVPLRVSKMSLPGREEKRVLLVAEFKDYFMACAHLSLTQVDRLLAVQKIQACMSDKVKPVFLAGDMNYHPSSREATLMCRDFWLLNDTAACSYPVTHPNELLDYIYLKKASFQYKVDSSFVLSDTVASDHRPVLVQVSLIKEK